MSFTAEDILTEFAEASRYGTRDVVALAQIALELRAERHLEYARDYQRSPKFRAWRRGFEAGRRASDRERRTTYVIVPVAVARWACPACGSLIERREGTRRAVHLGSITTCARRAA